MSKKILLVSGHVPGYNKCAETDVNEGDLNITLVDMLEDLLSPFCCVAVYPKDRDWYKDNKNGISQVNPEDYDYIFEVHFNAGKGTGASIYLHSDYNGGISVELGILKNLEDLGIKLRGNHGINRKDTLLNMNLCWRKGVDYALIETLFYDNPADMAFWKAHAQDIAIAIASGITDGFGLTKSDNQAGPGSSVPDTSGSVRYRVQAGSFANKANATAMADQLKADGYDAYVTTAGV